MAYFPLYIDLEQKECIVIGGGRVAEGKVRQLRSFGARVCVISPEVTAPLEKMAVRAFSDRRRMGKNACGQYIGRGGDQSQ